MDSITWLPTILITSHLLDQLYYPKATTTKVKPALTLKGFTAIKRNHQNVPFFLKQITVTNHDSVSNLVNTRVVLLLGKMILLSGSICLITLSITALCLFISVKRKI